MLLRSRAQIRGSNSPGRCVAACLHSLEEACFWYSMEAFGHCSSYHSFAMAVYWTVLGSDQSDDVQVESRYNYSTAVKCPGEISPVESTSCFAIDVSSGGGTGRTGCVRQVIRASPRAFLKSVIKSTLWLGSLLCDGNHRSRDCCTFEPLQS